MLWTLDRATNCSRAADGETVTAENRRDPTGLDQTEFDLFIDRSLCAQLKISNFYCDVATFGLILSCQIFVRKNLSYYEATM